MLRFIRMRLVGQKRPIAVLGWIILLNLMGVTIHSVERTEYRNTYWNKDYGFAVKVPPGMVGLGSNVGAPNHGIVINLKRESKIYIEAFYVNPDDNVPFPPAALPIRLPVETTEGTLEKDILTWLAGMRAERTLIRQPPTGSSTVLIDKVTAVRRDRRGNPYIRYEVALYTSTKCYSQARLIFEQVLHSFKVTSVP